MQTAIFVKPINHRSRNVKKKTKRGSFQPLILELGGRKQLLLLASGKNTKIKTRNTLSKKLNNIIVQHSYVRKAGERVTGSVLVHTRKHNK